MSTGNVFSTQPGNSVQSGVVPDAAIENAHGLEPLAQTVDKVRERISPVWPLKDYVAVNPYAGFAAEEFLATREYVRTLSDFELFMPVNYYREQFTRGAIHRADIAAAVDELVSDGVTGAERIDVNQVVAFLKEDASPSPTSDAEFTKASNANRTLRTVAETIDAQEESDWCEKIGEEISKQCATHFDQGQATWKSAWQQLPLYNAWLQEKLHDRTMEILGVAGFRRFVSQLPHDPHAALAGLLDELDIPAELWEDYLLCSALTLPGWSAWTKYQHRECEAEGDECSDFVGLLAMRLAYEVAVSRQSDFRVDWRSVAVRHAANRQHVSLASDHDLLRYALLRASEIAYRTRLVTDLRRQQSTANDRSLDSKSARRRLSQMVFCIDVRSERMRRHLETTSPEIETFGFAGFFGLPIEFVELGANDGNSNVPVLIRPQFKVHEELHEAENASHAASGRRGTLRFMRRAWKRFQSSAVSTFAFVEANGLLYGAKLLARSIGWKRRNRDRFDGVHEGDRARLSPSLRGLEQQGVDLSRQTEIAESILRGIGIVDDFARLVVFCGHGSSVENNPLKAGLECGACGGHSGEPNARFAAKLLNQPGVRNALAESGIMIPDDTHFVGALHNTTTDKLEFFDDYELPPSHRGDLEELIDRVSLATARTREERLPSLPGSNTEDLDRRSMDWSEVRPEWGLAGNAAFIVAPREMTRCVSLEGRSFLHSYDHRFDADFGVLEQILTAPMVVANWINMQYYASTVDPIHFGSGNKTVHNVVGGFGIFSGNGGDLMTGLPWQSVHDGQQYQHHPLRLLVVVNAPRSAIQDILARHPNVADLVSNAWLQLLAIEDGRFYRCTGQMGWEEVNDTSLAAHS